MGLFSFFKRRRQTRQTSFTSYKSLRPSYRKPFTPKVSPVYSADRNGRRRNEQPARFWLYVKFLLGLGLLGGGAYALFFTNWFEITSIEVNGEADTLEEQAALNTYLQDYIGENLILFNPLEHEAALLEEYGYLKTLDIDRDFFHTISVTLETHPPVANVRVDFEDGSSQYYMVNEKGLVSGTGNSEENLPMIVMDVTGTDMDLSVPETEAEAETEVEVETVAEPEVVSEETVVEPTEEVVEETPELNEELIPAETLTVLLDTAKSFEGKFNMQVIEIQYLKRAREIHLYTERSFYVWIDMTQDIATQLTKLKKALTELNIYEAPLEYIDLRISGQNGEKVIYKTY